MIRRIKKAVRTALVIALGLLEDDHDGWTLDIPVDSLDTEAMIDALEDVVVALELTMEALASQIGGGPDGDGGEPMPVPMPYIKVA